MMEEKALLLHLCQVTRILARDTRIFVLHPRWKLSPAFTRILLKSPGITRILFDISKSAQTNLFAGRKEKIDHRSIQMWSVMIYIYNEIRIFFKRFNIKFCIRKFILFFSIVWGWHWKMCPKSKKGIGKFEILLKLEYAGITQVWNEMRPKFFH